VERVLLARVGKKDSRAIDGYIADGGYAAWKRVVGGGLTPEQLTEEVKKSGLRGRGGAGFPTGVKWGFLPKDTKGKPIYLLCNADESEPGTFKDRLLMEEDPHQVIEGVALSAYAIKCQTAYIYIRGEFYDGARILDRALAEAYAKGFLGRNIMGSNVTLDITVHRGAGAYICGEETGLIESLEGKRGQPRIKPPFPAVHGVFGCPTIVNNVETLACVPHIVARGADWFKSIGPEKGPGPKLYCVSGHVKRPGVYEASMTITLRELIEERAGGVRDGRTLKAVIPGGSSVPIMTPGEVEECATDYEGIVAKGSMLGSGGMIVMDDTSCMVNVARFFVEFCMTESCGKCIPCRAGTAQMYTLLTRICEGTGTMDDLELLIELCGTVKETSLCGLGQTAPNPVLSTLKYFKNEYLEHIMHKRCPAGVCNMAGESAAEPAPVEVLA